MGLFEGDHRRPGARITRAVLRARLGPDAAIDEGIRELVDAGYITAPDAGTVELTADGFDAIQRGEPP
jgi:hypothetical protein